MVWVRIRVILNYGFTWLCMQCYESMLKEKTPLHVRVRERADDFEFLGEYYFSQQDGNEEITNAKIRSIFK